MANFEESNLSLIEENNLADDHGRILIVDDDFLVLKAIEMTLQKEGYEILTAQNGEEAIHILEKVPPAIIICDHTMPGKSGMEVMEKAQEIRPEAIRILLTASHSTDTAIEAINVGHVHQYITKPWKDGFLRKTVQTSLEKYKLIKENQVLQKLIFNQHKKLKKNHEGLQEELKLGAKIHEQLLLGKVPKNIPGLVIDALSCPSKEIDGDFFEFYRPSSHILDVVIGDVMGKGIAAALVGTAVKTQLIRFAMPFPYTQIFDHQFGWKDNLLQLDQILTLLHRSITKQLIDLEYFVSLFYCRFNLQYKTLSYVDCGSAKPIHYRAKKKEIHPLSGDNFPLGMVAEEQYHTREVPFSEGDIFVFYSDGVTEARNQSNELFGTDRLMQLVSNNSDLRASELLKLIRQAVVNFTKSDKLHDDLTLIVVKIGYYDYPDLAQFTNTQFCSDLSQLGAVRDFINRLCQKAPGDSERLANEMQLIVNEAFCNIVKHGHLEQSNLPVEIRGELHPDGIIVQLSDKGLPFDPSQVNEPSFSGNRDTGYGWHIIRELADKIIYTRKETLQGWNQLTIFKHYYFGERSMNLSHEKKGSTLVITPEGESLDARDAPEFKEKVIALINDSDANEVVFDLNHLQFIDSSGLGSFLSVLRILNSRGGDVKISHMNKPIRTMFELVKMHKIFEIFNSTEDAVGSFK